MNFENLQQVRDFVDSIPAEKFCQNMLESDDGRSCVSGHINKALHNNTYWKYDSSGGSYMDTDTGRLLSGFGADLVELVTANNSSDLGPKAGSLEYLDSILSKN